ncbi:hypothetical protein [Sphingomonas sp. BAUL-RG-20F-R05-02]|uniref:hypothetical protein n=1 Tax=Sphingomonas sp. BAUL-RG-20F-R05-02 TaxID=2914830 RepID=UPI001F5A904F|nr:hypothetical protein [Sphingomonas sp. BAUL-RG-20F-R05-02]
MASALYIRLLERKIERLKDPYGLSAREKAGIDGMLTVEELEEVDRLRREIYEYNEFMALPTDLYREYRFTMYNAFSLFYQEYPGQVSRLKSAKKRIAARRARGIKNPTAYAADEEKVRFHTEFPMVLVNSIRAAYEKMSAEDALFWEHRGEWTPDNLPRHVESWENVFWPNHPNARRQAYIEVFSNKIQQSRAGL